MFNNVFRKSCHLWDNVEKYDTDGETTDDNITRRMRFCMLDNWHTLRICNIYCFSRGTLCMWRVSMLCSHAHCLSVLSRLRAIRKQTGGKIYLWFYILGVCVEYECHIKLKVKWSRYRPGVVQRVGRGIALLFHDRGTRRGWVVSSTPRPHFTPGKDPVPILQEAGWASGPVSAGGKSRPHRDSIPDRPARSRSLYRLSYPAHMNVTWIL